MNIAIRILVFALLAAVSGLRAAEVYRLDQYIQVDPNQVSLVQAGKPAPLDKDMPLPNGFIMHTNGTLELQRGVEKKLSPGQQLTVDGLFISKDGRFLQVPDHYLISGGKPMLVQDGQARPVPGAITFKDGSKITPDGWLARPDGRRARLLDGHTIGLDGVSLPSQDFVMNRGGRIVLQKDGGLLTLDRSRVMAMSDGTKVRGDGRVTRTDGSEFVLNDGERINLPGVALR